MDRFSTYREQALRLRKLAEHGSEGELRAELRHLAAGLAESIVRAEIRAMSGAEGGERGKWRRGWRALVSGWWGLGDWGSVAAP